jgi:hypothetical protein
MRFTKTECRRIHDNNFTVLLKSKIVTTHYLVDWEISMLTK